MYGSLEPSSQPSLWVKWIKAYIIRKGSFWTVGDRSTKGSWMWRKLVKLRELAKDFHRMDIKSGHDTSFWYDLWSKKGRLKEVLGDRGLIEMGISETATVKEVLDTHRRRRHRISTYNEVETEIDTLRSLCSGQEHGDLALWKHGADTYKPKFTSKNTWLLMRSNHPACDWSRAVWFKYHTPRYSFMLWIVMLNRLATGDRMLGWNANIDPSCVLCSGHVESRTHLFFACDYSSQIWQPLARGLLRHRYTNSWEDIVDLAMGSSLKKTDQFLLRYTLEVSIHFIWRERNARKHGNQAQEHNTLTRFIDREVRNKLTIIREAGGTDLADGMGTWLGSLHSAQN